MELVQRLEPDFHKVTIDEEFSAILPPLSQEEQKQLEANILADGYVRDPLIAWNKDRIVLVNGYNRYSVACTHSLRYSIDLYDFSDREEALRWIVADQLGRRNLPPGIRAGLAAALVSKDLDPEELATAIAKSAQVSRSTAKRASKPKSKSRPRRVVDVNSNGKRTSEIPEGIDEEVDVALLDMKGQPVTPDLAHAFQAVPTFSKAVNELRAAKTTIIALRDHIVGYWVSNLAIDKRIEELIALMQDATPYCTCPACEGARVTEDLDECPLCKGLGWIPKYLNERFDKAFAAAQKNGRGRT